MNNNTPRALTPEEQIGMINVILENCKLNSRQKVAKLVEPDWVTQTSLIIARRKLVDALAEIPYIGSCKGYADKISQKIYILDAATNALICIRCGE